MEAVNDHQPKPRKTSKGKQKIEIIKRENKDSRQVTFSKRRTGLFKKCDVLCKDYNAQIAVITFSEAGKLYPHGNPNPEFVIQRFLDSNNYDDDHSYGVNAEDCRASSCNSGFWWDDVQVDNLGFSELEFLMASLESLRIQVASRVDEINRNSTSLVPNNNRSGLDDCCYRPVMDSYDIGTSNLMNHGMVQAVNQPNFPSVNSSLSTNSYT